MIDTYIGDDGPAADASDRTIRQFAALGGLLLGAGAVSDFTRGASGRAGSLALVAVSVVAIGVVRPRMIRPVFIAALAITVPVRAVVSAIILGIMYYVVFTPIAVVFRLAGRDALSRRRHTEAPTYWVPKVTAADVRSYFRQS